jgi:hypothetical protein
MPFFMVFETIIEQLYASLEITSCIYVCFVLWHVNIYITMSCLACFMSYAYVPFVALNFDAPSVHMACKDKPK